MRLQVSEAAVLRREANNRRRLAAGISDPQARLTLERVAEGLEEEAKQIEITIAENAAAKQLLKDAEKDAE
jgi:sirohydrochlorin ferrochelatase